MYCAAQCARLSETLWDAFADMAAMLPEECMTDVAEASADISGYMEDVNTRVEDMSPRRKTIKTSATQWLNGNA